MELCAELSCYFEMPTNCGALYLEDFDGDGNLELAIGHGNGHLMLLRLPKQPNCSKPPDMLHGAGDLGLITAMCYGDLFNNHRPVLVVINAAGNLNAFAINTDLDGLVHLELIDFKQVLPANISVAYISDLDQDGEVELLVSLTDRVLRTYRYISEVGAEGHLVPLNKWEMPAHICALAMSATSQMYISQSSLNYVKLDLAADIETDEFGQEMPEKSVEFVVPKWANGEQMAIAAGAGHTYLFLPKDVVAVRIPFTLISHVVLVESQNDQFMELPYSYQVSGMQILEMGGAKLLLLNDWAGMVCLVLIGENGLNYAQVKVAQNVLMLTGKLIENSTKLVIVVATVTQEVFVYNVNLQRFLARIE